MLNLFHETPAAHLISAAVQFHIVGHLESEVLVEGQVALAVGEET